MEITAIKLDSLSSCPSSFLQLQQQGHLLLIGTPAGSPLEINGNGSETSVNEKPAKILKCSKTYNSKWEKVPILKSWIERHPRDNGKVVCRFCQSVIRAHKNDLLEHTRTLKHQRNFLQNSTIEEYDQFVIDLKSETNSNAKKRLNSPLTLTTAITAPTTEMIFQSLSSSSQTKHDQATITLIAAANNSTTNPTVNGNVNSMRLTSSNPLFNDNCTVMQSLLSPVMSNVPPTPSVIPGSVNNSGNSNNISVDTNSINGVSTILNMTSNSSGNGDGDNSLEHVDISEDLWQESEEFISAEANSPSDLVSVILEEQQSPNSCSPTSNNDPSGNNHSTLLTNETEPCSGIRTSMDGLNSMILSGYGLSTNTVGLNSLNMSLNLLDSGCGTADGQSHNLQAHNSTDQENGHGTLINAQMIAPNTVGNHNEDGDNNGDHETLLLTKAGEPLPFTLADVLTAIEGGHFSFPELCSLARASASQIDRCINGPFVSEGGTSNNTGLTLCTSTTAGGPNYVNCNMNLPSLSIVSPHGTNVHPILTSSNNVFSVKKDRSSRKRKAQEN